MNGSSLPMRTCCSNRTGSHHWRATPRADAILFSVARKSPGKAGGTFAALQRFQLEFLFAAAYAFHAAGIDGSCMGNNLLVRKRAYHEVGGQATIGYCIVEDRGLYAAFKRRNMSIAPAHPFFAKTATYPCDTVAQFYQQMLRWARGGFSLGATLFAAGMLFAVQNVSVIAATAGLLKPVNAVLSVVNFLGTMTFTHLAFKKIGSSETALFYPVHQVFVALEILVFCLSFLITPKVIWKKRQV